MLSGGKKRLAVVLFNLGGPSNLAAVRPFLFNLFNDRAIINLPAPFRFCLASLIAWRRASVARDIYQQLGGGSPLLRQTEMQAQALTEELKTETREARCFVAMRYWHPLSEQTAAAVAAFKPDDIVLLPLYPQFSTTTTESSVNDWHRAASRAGILAPTRVVCCYPTAAGWIDGVVGRVRSVLAALTPGQRYRVLFSAHGLPKKVIARGDPYQWQVEATVAKVVSELGIEDLDFAICYQSRVGPLAWIGPSTREELARAAADDVTAVIVPIAFVSEHSETLVELDIEYRKEAETLGVPGYHRVETVGAAPEFIAGLSALVEAAITRDEAVAPAGGERICPAGFGRCLCGRSPAR